MAQTDNDKLTDERREIISGSLRAHRARVRETQKEAAEAVGVNQTTLCAWENRGGASDVSLWALADHYGVSLDALLGRPWPPREG